MTQKNRDKFLDDRFAYDQEETVTVNALELCDLLISEESLERQAKSMSKRIEYLEALVVKLPDMRLRIEYLESLLFDKALVGTYVNLRG